MFEIFDIIPHLKFCENQYPIPVLNHLNYPFSWAAFCVLTVDTEGKNSIKIQLEITLAGIFLNEKHLIADLRCHNGVINDLMEFTQTKIVQLLIIMRGSEHETRVDLVIRE